MAFNFTYVASANIKNNTKIKLSLKVTKLVHVTEKIDHYRSNKYELTEKQI